MGYHDLYHIHVDGSRQSGASGQSLDQIYCFGYPWVVRLVARVVSGLCNCCPTYQCIEGIPGCSSSHISKFVILGYSFQCVSPMPNQRLCLEILQKNSKPRELPLCSGDSEVQHSRLQTKNGAVREGHPQGEASSKNQETKRFRFLAGWWSKSRKNRQTIWYYQKKGGIRRVERESLAYYESIIQRLKQRNSNLMCTTLPRSKIWVRLRSVMRRQHSRDQCQKNTLPRRRKWR